jgi:hypothetical protein
LSYTADHGRFIIAAAGEDQNTRFGIGEEAYKVERGLVGEVKIIQELVYRLVDTTPY